MAVTYYGKLLRCITEGLNDQAMLMLTPYLAKVSDEFGTLLHHAAFSDNQDIAQRLIVMGSEVDAIGRHGYTPLMLAFKRRCPVVVKTLLEAGASVDAVNTKGQSALRMAFDSREPMCADTVKLLFDRERAAAPTREKLADRLLKVGFTLNHAVCTEDVDFVELMLTRDDIHVHSRGYYERTALLDAACKTNDVAMARILCDNDADVNALDSMGNSALTYAALHGNADLVQLLLDRGADPNAVNEYGMSPLYVLLMNAHIDAEPAERCAELLLRRGASIGISSYDSMAFLNEAMSNHNPTLVDNLVACSTMLGVFETSDSRHIRERNRLWFHKCVSYHEKCGEVLGARVFGEMTLADLLTKQSEHKMRLLVRNQRFMCNLEEFCSENKLQGWFPFYYNTLWGRIAKTKRRVELEDEAVPVVIAIFSSSYNQFYIAARKIFEYLEKSDLAQLCQV